MPIFCKSGTKTKSMDNRYRVWRGNPRKSHRNLFLCFFIFHLLLPDHSFSPLFLPPFPLPLLSSRSISTPLPFRKWQASPRSQPNMAQKTEVRAGISLILRLGEATQQEEKCLKSRQESPRQSCSHCQVSTRTPHYTIMTYRQTIQVRHRQVLWLLLLSM